MADEFEIVRKGTNGVEVLETRTGDLPEYGELIEVTVDGADVEWYVISTETVNKRAGRITRITVSSKSPDTGSVGFF